MTSVTTRLVATAWTSGHFQWVLLAVTFIAGYPRLEGASRLNAGNSCLIKSLAAGTSIELCGAVLRQVADEAPDNGRARVHIGLVHFHSGEFQNALSALGVLPDDAVAGLYFGLSAEALGRREVAIDAWRRVGAGKYFFSHGEAARRSGQLEFAVELYERAILIDRGSEETRLAAAEAHIGLGEYDEVEALLDSAVTKERGYELLGLARYRQGQMAGARDAFSRALEIRPGNYMAHWLLGKIYWQWGEWEDALREFEAIAAGQMVVGDHAPPYWAAAAMHEKLGETELALRKFLDGTQADPSYYPNHLSAGRIYLQMGKTAEAMAIYREHLRLYPNNVSVLEALAAMEPLER